MYKLYCDKCVEQKRSQSKTAFIVTFFLQSSSYPSIDLNYTCDTCDILDNLIKNSTTKVVVAEAKETKRLHLKKAASVKNVKDVDSALAKDDRSKIVVCCDLEKTLPTTALTCE